MPQPPSYRKADEPGKNCGTCTYFYPLASNCRRYNYKVSAGMVCRTWKAGMQKGASMKEYFENMSNIDLSFQEGFIQKCAELGLDPEAMMKVAQNKYIPPNPAIDAYNPSLSQTLSQGWNSFNQADTIPDAMQRFSRARRDAAAKPVDTTQDAAMTDLRKKVMGGMAPHGAVNAYRNLQQQFSKVGPVAKPAAPTAKPTAAAPAPAPTAKPIAAAPATAPTAKPIAAAAPAAKPVAPAVAPTAPAAPTFKAQKPAVLPTPAVTPTVGLDQPSVSTPAIAGAPTPGVFQGGKAINTADRKAFTPVSSNARAAQQNQADYGKQKATVIEAARQRSPNDPYVQASLKDFETEALPRDPNIKPHMVNLPSNAGRFNPSAQADRKDDPAHALARQRGFFVGDLPSGSTAVAYGTNYPPPRQVAPATPAAAPTAQVAAAQPASAAAPGRNPSPFPSRNQTATPVAQAQPVQQPAPAPAPDPYVARRQYENRPFRFEKRGMDVNYLRKTAEQLFGKTAQGLVAPGAQPSFSTRAWGNDTELDRQFGSAKPPVEGKPAKVGGGTAPAQQFKAQLAQVKQPPTQLDTPTY